MEMEIPSIRSGSETESTIPSFPSKTEKAVYLIRTYLKDGKVLSNEMYRRLKEDGISHKTAEKTRISMGVVCRRVMNRWYWSLPNAAGEEKQSDKAALEDTGDASWKMR